MYVANGQIYTFDDLQRFVADIGTYGTRKKRGVSYVDLPCAFDIETTSFYIDGNKYGTKAATMYVWQFGINGHVIIGRTWAEYDKLMDALIDAFGLGKKTHLIVYVHNLSYEFQWVRKRHEWTKVFALSERTPVYAITSTGIEFKCSYILSGYGLAKVGEHLQKYPVAKMVGDLDYDLPRHSRTPLTDKEIGYCVNDVRVVMAYIMEMIEQYGGINRIPMTKTGIVRGYCKAHTLRVKSEISGKQVTNWLYRGYMREMQLNGLDEFHALKRAFQGGFTHANANHVRETLENVTSYDFTSSYPSVMVAELYPMSRGVKVRVKSSSHFVELISRYLCVFDIEFNGLCARVTYENILSSSKCWYADTISVNNGRIVTAACVRTTMTNIDYECMQRFYTWDSARVIDVWCYKAGYLPTDFVKCILKFYADKTTLKGVDGKEREYLAAKEMLNSCYGMSVTDPVRDEITYNGRWGLHEKTLQEQSEEIFKYNRNQNRFLFYPWGVFVTAYARRNLYTAILECKDDYVYSDTDSCKLLNADAHRAYFDRYNNWILERLRKACKYHKIDFDMIEPTTIKGITKPMGVWDFDGHYTKFKTLGAKRYMYSDDNGKLHITISGLGKSVGEWLQAEYGEYAYTQFDDYMSVPADKTGKKLHTYIDEETSCYLTDYLGETIEVHERASIHLEDTPFTLSLSIMYLNFLNGLKLY